MYLVCISIGIRFFLAMFLFGFHCVVLGLGFGIWFFKCCVLFLYNAVLLGFDHWINVWLLWTWMVSWCNPHTETYSHRLCIWQGTWHTWFYSWKIALGSVSLWGIFVYMPAEQFGTHSLRIGSTTSVAEVRIPIKIIKAMGRWTSDCYRRYIRTPHRTLRHMTHNLCTSQQ